MAHRFVRQGLISVLDADERFTVVQGQADACDVVLIDGATDEPVPTSGRVLRLGQAALSEVDAATRVDGLGLMDLLALLAGTSNVPESGGDIPERAQSVLTHREIEILRALASVGTARLVAEQLGISPKTVDRHKQRIFAKLGARNLAHVVAIGFERGWLAGSRSPSRTGSAP